MTTAAEQVAGSIYLLEEILICLPAKSLARSKLVSKQWLSQISDPQFLRLHSRRKPNKLPTGMFLTDSKSICSNADFNSFSELNPTYQTIPSLGFLYKGVKQLIGDDFSDIKLLNSCNGLLVSLVKLKFNPPHFTAYCVCNPTTKKLRLLPRAPFSASSIMNTYLAFDPSLSLHYKVICTKNFTESNPYEIYIYSSENRCWSTYASPFDPRRDWFFLNGSMYCSQKSLRFDVDTEKMERMTLAPRTCLPVMGSHVYCTEKKGHTTSDLRVLEMSSDFSEWLPKYNLNIRSLLSAFPEIAILLKLPERKMVFHCFSVICAVEGVKENELGVVLGIPGKVILCNLKEKTAKELCKLRGELSDMAGHQMARVYQFIESLSVVV